MNNAERILRRLDASLAESVDLTLYGRAALQLGYSNPLPAYANSLDVDVILWIGQAEELADRGGFWEAVAEVNQALAGDGLYISHFFEEVQVILRSEWREHRVPIGGGWIHLSLYRLADEDLFLSKLMRFDPIDLEDARFIWSQAGWSREQVREIIQAARVPDIAEIREQFALCTAEMLGGELRP